MTETSRILSRRMFSYGLAVSGFGLFAGARASLAAPVDPGFGQAEWEQKYDTADALRIPRATTPLLSSQTVAATEAAIQIYRDIAGRGGWPNVPTQTMKVGAKGPAVVALPRTPASSDPRAHGDSALLDPEGD